MTIFTEHLRKLSINVVRPIPRVASPSAQAGTLLHAWAERFVNASDDGVPEPAAVGAAASSDMTAMPLAVGTSGESRESLLAELEMRERDPDPDARERDLTVWKRRLAASRWARRRPAWAERQIVLPALSQAVRLRSAEV